MKRKAGWTCLVLLLAVLVYQFAPDGSSETNAGVRSRAVDLLGIIGDRRAIDVLIDRLSDSDREVRLMAYKSLRMLTNIDHGPDPAAWKAWRRDAP